MARKLHIGQAQPRRRKRSARDWVADWSILRPFVVVTVVAALSFSGWRGYQWLMQPDTLPIRHVKVIGKVDHLDSRVLASRLREAVVGGFFSLDLADLKRKIKAMPWVYDVSLRRIWPDTLEVSIEEQQPIARWGDHELLNRYGEVFDPKGVFPKVALPLISGMKGRETDLILFFNQADKVLNPLNLKMVELREDARGDQRLVLDNGIQLALGRKNRLKRLRRFARAYRKTLQPFMDRIAVLDLRYANGFAVRWNRAVGRYTKTRMNRI